MSNKFISWSIFIILCIIWGSSFKLMKDSGQQLSGAQVAALRIFSAGIVFVPFAFIFYAKIPRKKISPVILSAVFGNLLPAFLFAIAMRKIDGSLGGTLNSLTPICVLVIGIVFFRNKIKLQKILGVVTGFVGLVLLTLAPVLTGQKNIQFTHISYSLMILLATFLYGINVNMVGHYLKNVNPLHAATVSLAFMTIPTIFILWQQDFFLLDFSNPAIQLAIGESVTLGILASAIATVLFYILVQKAGIIFASLVTYGVPFIALLWGLFDHEHITWLQIVCLGIILLGVYLANRPEKKLKAPQKVGETVL